jgi:arsenate reductase
MEKNAKLQGGKIESYGGPSNRASKNMAVPPAACSIRLYDTFFANDRIAMDITIYHNPSCGSSRNTLALIRNTGAEPVVIDYLANPPSHALLTAMIAAAGLSVRDAIRPKEAVYAELGLDNPALGDDALIDAMLAHPVLINRPFVITPLGVRLCRPSELVLDILPLPQLSGFSKQDGEAVIDSDGKRIRNT